MKFPLHQHILIRGAATHVADGLGIAADYRAHFVPLYAPVSGETELFQESGGGLWIRLRGIDGLTYEFAHLSQRNLARTIREGEQIGVTGNSGRITSGAHLHIQILKNGSRIDPETLFTKKATTGGKVTEDQYAQTYYELAGNLWKHGHPGKTPSEESLKADCRDAAKRRVNGETYAFNSYVDRWYKGE